MSEPVEKVISQGRHTVLVDDDDWERLELWKCDHWRAGEHHIEVQTETLSDEVWKLRWISLPRLILDVDTKTLITHRNGDFLDNRKENLVSSLQEAPRARSGFKGVYRNGSRWRAVLRHQGKSFCLGTFATQMEAAQAYDAKASELLGSLAKLNITPDGLVTSCPPVPVDGQSGLVTRSPPDQVDKVPLVTTPVTPGSGRGSY